MTISSWNTLNDVPLLLLNVKISDCERASKSMLSSCLGKRLESPLGIIGNILKVTTGTWFKTYDMVCIIKKIFF